ncbi:NINE protein [Fulvivirga maritima]|uniref:NINE protein n=1 Tax=Fulvivirga maritima TaxID=2904247 RepID=UPI001F4078E4|nr:NINE protein [Fulvivirga maritima]UII27419.1 NINE protein [Fulvivirga maritima]
MANTYDHIPELEGEELAYIQMIIGSLTEEKAAKFFSVYRARRRKPQETLIFAILGLFCIAGIQRFALNQIGMGLLYFFTAGLCYIGTIIDIINYQKLSFEYNRQIADDIKITMGI